LRFLPTPGAEVNGSIKATYFKLVLIFIVWDYCCHIAFVIDAIFQGFLKLIAGAEIVLHITR